jgi:acyl carrier protein
VSTKNEIQEVIRRHLAEVFEVEPGEIDMEASFNQLGVDSSCAVALVGDLENYLGMEIEPTLPYDYPSVRKLAEQLASKS